VIAPTIAGSGRRLLTDCRPSGSNRSEARRRQLGNCSWITASFVSRRSRGHRYSRRVATDAEALHRCAEPALPDEAAFCFRCSGVVGESAADRFVATALYCGDDARAPERQWRAARDALMSLPRRRIGGNNGLRCRLHPPMNDSHQPWISSRGPASTGSAFDSHPGTSRRRRSGPGPGLKSSEQQVRETYSLKIRGGTYIPASVEPDLH
jgi:hypothetical protein